MDLKGPMSRLPPLPEKSGIDAREVGEDVYLQLHIPSGGILYATLALISAGCLGIWIAWILFLYSRMSAIAGAKFLAFRFPLALIGVMGIFTGLWHTWRLIRPTLPELLRITYDDIEFTPGRPPIRLWYTKKLSEPFGPPDPVREPTSYSRKSIRHFYLDREEGRQRLYFNAGRKCIEIGKGLSEKDREWLFLLLEKWHNYAPRDSDAVANKSV